MAGSTPNRRDFLRGKAALRAAADLVDAAIDALAPAEPPPSRPASPAEGPRILTLSRRAMACDFELRLCASRGVNPTAEGMAALDLVERLETQLTVYRERSELIDLNRQAAGGPVVVEPGLFGLLSLAGELHEATGGAFDPTSGPLSRVWGFHQRRGELPAEADRLAALGRVGWAGVRLDPGDRSVRFDRDGIELNVNSIGKGYALDRAGGLLVERGVGDWLLHGGRSTLLARGDNPLLEGGGWRAGLRDPLNPRRRLAELTLRNEALSTSGGGTQFFEHGGKRYGHVIDPRTGWPAEGLFSASVIAPTGAEADALSTAFYVMGPDRAAEYCQSRPEVKALLVTPAGGPGEGANERAKVIALNLDQVPWRPQD